MGSIPEILHLNWHRIFDEQKVVGEIKYFDVPVIRNELLDEFFPRIYQCREYRCHIQIQFIHSN